MTSKKNVDSLIFVGVHIVTKQMSWYESTPYIRVFRDVHPMASLWGFFEQCLYQRLELVADYAGVLDLPDVVRGDLSKGIAMLIGCSDPDWVAAHLPKLMAEPDPAVVHVEIDGKHYLVLTSYREAQNRNQGNAASGRKTRKRQRDHQRAALLGLIEDYKKTG